MVSDTAPLVSVIIPVYNHAGLITEAIDSVLKQSYHKERMEIIVVDDGSIDDTKSTVSKYGDEIIYIYQEHSGKAQATKNGIDISKGKYIFNLDSDDIFYPDKVRRVVDIFENDREIVHVAHPVIYWYVDSGLKKEEFMPREIKGHRLLGNKLLYSFYSRYKFYGGGSTFAGRGEIVRSIPIDKKMGGHIDEALSLFTMNCGYSFFIDKALSFYRIHDNNLSRRESIKEQLDMTETILAYILKSDFEEEIKTLYALKAKVLRLRHKEANDRKNFSDIVSIWKYILKNRRLLSGDIFGIMKNYRILQRSMPTFMLRLARRLNSYI